MTTDDPDTQEATVWWKSPFGMVGARGRHLTHLAYVTVLVAFCLIAIWLHDQGTVYRTAQNQAAIAEVAKAVRDATIALEASDRRRSDETREIVYVLTRDDKERKALNIEMPDTLRKRAR